jgi:toxin ParE1/3/4
MASPKPTLTVLRSPIANDELDGIWRWNAQRYSPIHADTYLRYLEDGIDGLEREYPKGKMVIVRPDLRYIIVRRKAKGHGHVVVYRFDDKRVDVLHVFHTAQDWPAILSEETPSQ